jgi:hypothetical protein
MDPVSALKSVVVGGRPVDGLMMEKIVIHYMAVVRKVESSSEVWKVTRKVIEIAVERKDSF